MATINVRVDSELKKKAAEFFESLGMDMSTAINIFIRQALYRGEIPFEIRKPNRETLEALAECRAIMNGEIEAKRYKSHAELVKEIEEEMERDGEYV